MADPTLPDPTLAPIPPPVGLINSTPGAVTTTPGTTPAGAPGPGSPVTSYNPATATAAAAGTSGYVPAPYTVAPNATVASNLQSIIASGSPLMQQAEANARNQMNARGLINSTLGVTAGQSAVIGAATPIATADAATYDRAATNTTNAQNTEAASTAAATNTAAQQAAAAQTQTEQFNAGQFNAAMSTAATASNAVAALSQQIQGSKDVTTIQTNASAAIASLQAATNLSIQDKTSATSTLIAGIQANTSLSNQDKQDLTSRAIAGIQSDTSLSVEQQQTASAQAIASMNNASALAVQQTQNAGNLANIQANGVVNTAITKLTDDNKTLLQTSQGAATIYNQGLTNIANIINNPNLSEAQKATAMNDGVQQLNDALATLTTIASLPDAQSTLVFT